MATLYSTGPLLNVPVTLVEVRILIENNDLLTPTGVTVTLINLRGEGGRSFVVARRTLTTNPLSSRVVSFDVSGGFFNSQFEVQFLVSGADEQVLLSVWGLGRSRVRPEVRVLHSELTRLPFPVFPPPVVQVLGRDVGDVFDVSLVDFDRDDLDSEDSVSDDSSGS